MSIFLPRVIFPQGFVVLEGDKQWFTAAAYWAFSLSTDIGILTGFQPIPADSSDVQKASQLSFLFQTWEKSVMREAHKLKTDRKRVSKRCRCALIYIITVCLYCTSAAVMQACDDSVSFAHTHTLIHCKCFSGVVNNTRCAYDVDFEWMAAYSSWTHACPQFQCQMDSGSQTVL